MSKLTTNSIVTQAKLMSCISAKIGINFKNNFNKIITYEQEMETSVGQGHECV